MKEMLVRPIITEKSMIKASESKFIFEVASDINKHQIAKSVEDHFKVNVIKVNIIKVKPSTRIVRGKMTTSKAYKKAVVTLKKGQKIEGFEIKE